MQIASSIDYKSLYEQSQLKIAALEQQLQKLHELSEIKLIELRQQLAQLQKMVFGSKQERFIPSSPDSSQLALDIQAESTASCSIVNAKKISYIKTNIAVEQKPLQHPGRMKLPESLRREQIIIEPTDDITGCKKMGEEITEILEYQPGELFVKKIHSQQIRKAG
jgi:hypothetical protein